jgi:hypothetical protein
VFSQAAIPRIKMLTRKHMNSFFIKHLSSLFDRPILQQKGADEMQMR